ALARTEAASGRGVLVITHDGDIVKSIANRVLYLPGDGSLVNLKVSDLLGKGPCQTVVSHPTDHYHD
ncbi:MAG: hypothetical protein V3T31_00645, partial [candidate division Zixibacteria bacterium]